VFCEFGYFEKKGNRPILISYILYHVAVTGLAESRSLGRRENTPVVISKPRA
jgi:hypothetical protein